MLLFFYFSFTEVVCVCVSVNSFMGFYDFIFRLVSSGQMERKMIFLSIQVYFKYLWIDSSIIFVFWFFLYSKMLLTPIFMNSSCNPTQPGHPFVMVGSLSYLGKLFSI